MNSRAIKDKSRRKAAILSLLWNGLGQVYLGYRKKGFLLMVLSAFGIMVTVWGTLLIIKPVLKEFQKGTLFCLFSDYTANLILGGLLVFFQEELTPLGARFPTKIDPSGDPDIILFA